MKKRLLVLLFATAALSASTVAPAPTSVYEYLTKVFLQSCEVNKDAASVIAASNEQQKKLDLTVRSIGDMQQRVLFTHMLQQMCGTEKLSPVISTDGLQQLDIINTGNAGSLSVHLAPQTLFGEVLLTKMLALPLSDAAAIEQRQQVLKEFAAHPEISVRLAHAFDQIKNGQALFFSFFDKENQLSNEILKQVYWPNDRLNKSMLALCGLRGFLNFAFALNLVPVESLLSFDPLLAEEMRRAPQGLLKAWRYGAVVPAKAFCTGLHMLVQRHNVFSKYTDEQVAQHLKCKTAGQYVIAAQTLPVRNQQPNIIKAGVLIEAFDVLRILMLVPVLRAQNKIFFNMQERLIGAAHIVRGLKEINNVLRDYPQLITLLPQLKRIQELFSGALGSEMKRLVNVLQTRTFTGKPSFFSNGPRILLAYKLMDLHRNEFAPALEAAGTLDACTAVARQMHIAGSARYCFVELSADELPVVQLDNFWNPLMPTKDAITNSVKLGKDGDRNMLITGPNGSGKSTNMKAVVLNVLLGQTFGIAAAEHAVLTPFTHINVYINVKENLQEGKSTFMAEADRLRMICQDVALLKSGQRGLTIVDEGLRGTVAQEASERLCAAIEDIVRVPHNICMFATHLQEPTALEATLSRAIVNYYVELQEPALGQFVRTFKLQRGINEWWFNDAGRRKRFVDWLVSLKK